MSFDVPVDAKPRGKQQCGDAARPCDYDPDGQQPQIACKSGMLPNDWLAGSTTACSFLTVQLAYRII